MCVSTRRAGLGTLVRYVTVQQIELYQSKLPNSETMGILSLAIFFVRYVSPDGKDLSIVIETAQSTTTNTLNITLDG